MENKVIETLDKIYSIDMYTQIKEAYFNLVEDITEDIQKIKEIIEKSKDEFLIKQLREKLSAESPLYLKAVFSILKTQIENTIGIVNLHEELQKKNKLKTYLKLLGGDIEYLSLANEEQFEKIKLLTRIDLNEMDTVDDEFIKVLYSESESTAELITEEEVKQAVDELVDKADKIEKPSNEADFVYDTLDKLFESLDQDMQGKTDSPAEFEDFILKCKLNPEFESCITNRSGLQEILEEYGDENPLEVLATKLFYNLQYCAAIEKIGRLADFENRIQKRTGLFKSEPMNTPFIFAEEYFKKFKEVGKEIDFTYYVATPNSEKTEYFFLAKPDEIEFFIDNIDEIINSAKTLLNRKEVLKMSYFTDSTSIDRIIIGELDEKGFEELYIENAKRFYIRLYLVEIFAKMYDTIREKI